MSAIKVNLDGLDSSAIQIRTVALTLGDLKSSMNRVFSSIDPKIKRRRNISGSIADIQKEMEMLYTEMNELGGFISSSKSQYANTEARLFQMSSDYTNRFRAMLAESANAEENWLERIGYAVIGNAKGLESFLKQAGDLIVNVGSKVISGVEGVAVSSVCNCVEGFANAGFGVAEFFHLVPDTSARYEFKHDLDAFQAAIADQYVLDKQWYYGGRAIGDIASSIMGTKIAANGLIAVAAGLVGEGVGAGFTVTGAGAVAGVPAMVVSGAAVAVGALGVAAGLSVSAVSIKNFRDDFSKFQQEGRDKGGSKSKGSGKLTTGADWSGKTSELAKTAPTTIPSNATVKVQSKTGYDQISYKWSDGVYKYEARWHTKTPGAPAGQGNTWVVERTTPGTPTGQKAVTHILTGDNQWTSRYDWQQAIAAHQNGIATEAQKALLEGGHWIAP